MIKIAVSLLALSLLLCSASVPSTIFSCTDGNLSFVSNATLEVIRAQSNKVRGAIDITARTFAFTMNVNTFQGFNSALQREHFNENYLESEVYPTASFKGKLIEEMDLRAAGIYEIRAKGVLDVHGVKQERIIRGTVEVTDSSLHVHSVFSVLLEDHNIKIPRVVYQKISPEILVTLDARLKPAD